MARIPPEELERLKAEVSVEHLVAASGVELKAAGKDLLGRCPFHEDREASLVVTPGKNLWHCFSCQIGGGPIDWMMKSKGRSGMRWNCCARVARSPPRALAAAGCCLRRWSSMPAIKR
jgi:hypothetical protein